MKTKQIVWLVTGIILALGPIWGIVGTIVGMLMAFHNLGQAQPQVEALAWNISLALYATVAGWIACPIGIVIFVVSVLKLVQSKAETGGAHHPTVS